VSQNLHIVYNTPYHCSHSRRNEIAFVQIFTEFTNSNTKGSDGVFGEVTKYYFYISSVLLTMVMMTMIVDL